LTSGARRTEPRTISGVLDEARGTGMDRVLAVCAVDNAASVKTIERCGGAFETISDRGTGPLRRYWFQL
jgi:predicted acetyltransferase